MHEAVAEDDRTQRELLRRSLRDKRASLAEGLVRAMSADVCAAVAVLAALQIADELTRSQQEVVRERTRRADLRRRVRDKSRSIRALIDREVKA